MSHRFIQLLSALALPLTLFAPAHAAIVTHPGGTVYTGSDNAAFQIAAPALTFEDFATTRPNVLQSCDGPLSSAHGNLCFNVGDIVPGVTVNVVQPPATDLMLRAPVNTLPTTSPTNSIDAVGPNSTADDLSIVFSGGPDAFSLDLVSLGGTGTLSVSLFDVDGLAFLNTSISITTGTALFFGVIANQPILEVQFSGSGIAEGIGNLHFGTVPTGSSGGGMPIPEPGTLSLLGIGLAAALWRRRRDR